VTIKREGDQWYVVFIVETEIAPLPTNNEIVGVDLGINLLAALFNGDTVRQPLPLKLKQQQPARHQWAASVEPKPSGKWSTCTTSYRKPT